MALSNKLWKNLHSLQLAQVDVQTQVQSAMDTVHADITRPWDPHQYSHSLSTHSLVCWTEIHPAAHRINSDVNEHLIHHHHQQWPQRAHDTPSSSTVTSTSTWYTIIINSDVNEHMIHHHHQQWPQRAHDTPSSSTVTSTTLCSTTNTVITHTHTKL